MKQGNNNHKLDVFNPFWGLQPMLSPRSRTLPPIKTRSSRDFRTSKLCPSRIPVRIPIAREKQQRRMTKNDEVNPGIDGPFPKFSYNLEQRNQLCAKTRQHEEEWAGRKPEEALEKKHLSNENSERLPLETSSLPSYGIHNRSEKDENKITREKAAGESEMKLLKSSSWANSFDHRGTQMNDMPRTDYLPPKQSSIKNKSGEKRMQNLTIKRERNLGRHLKPLQEKFTGCREIKAREERGMINTSLSGQTPSVVIDSYEEVGDFEEENKNILEYKKRFTTEKVPCRRHRTLAKLEDTPAAQVKRMASPIGGPNHGILCKPKLHKINSLP